jgi:hypothetical protein
MRKRHKLNPWHLGAVYKTWTHVADNGDITRTSFLSYPMNPRKILTKAQGRVGTRKQAKRRRAKSFATLWDGFFKMEPHCEPEIHHI